MIRCLVFLLLWFVIAPSAQATPIIADISTHRIEIFSGFTGTQLLLFGARNDPGDIVIAIRGPEENMVVRQKMRRAGIWVNRHETEFENIPHYYALASSKPITELRGNGQFPALQLYDESNVGDDPFRRAMFRILSEQKLYSLVATPVEFMGETLFKASFHFPDNVPRGVYTAEVYLFSDGQIVGAQSIPIEVVKTGSDAFMYDAAIHHGFWYGVVAIWMAMVLGWAANWLFQRI